MPRPENTLHTPVSCPGGDNRPRREAVAVHIPAGEVERRSLDVYDLAALGGAR